MNKRKYEIFKDAAATLDDDQYVKGYHLGLKHFYFDADFVVKQAVIDTWTKSYKAGYKAGKAGKPAKGIDGRIGNANQSGIDADTKLFARISSDEKEVFRAIAKAEGKSLSQWVIEACRSKL